MKYEDIPKEYINLTSIYLPKKIPNELEYELVLKLIEIFMNYDLNKDQTDYFEEMVCSVIDYEEKYYPI